MTIRPRPSPTEPNRKGLAMTVAALLAVAAGDGHMSAGAAQTARQNAVPAQKGPGKAGTVPALAVTIVQDQGRLPQKVAAMRDAILAAARSGDIEAMRTPLEWNELPPEISVGPVADPIGYWKGQSGDGTGRQILAVLVSILESTPVAVGAGAPGELYVWPGFAELDLAALSPAQEVQLYRLITPAEAQAAREKRKWAWYRLSIGADGTWHGFLKAE